MWNFGPARAMRRNLSTAPEGVNEKPGTDHYFLWPCIYFLFDSKEMVVCPRFRR